MTTPTYLACLKAGAVACFEDFTGDDPHAFVADRNLHRRHLRPSQLGMIGAHMANLALGSNQFKKEGVGIPTPSISCAQAAHVLNVNRTTIVDGRVVLNEGTYEEACVAVFKTLDELEDRLGSHGPYLFGNRLTESDIRLSVTLIRFDAAYHGLFKCNLHRIADYPRLKDYMKHILDIDGIASTVNLNHIKAGYYSIKALNPSGIVPLGPS